MDLGVRDRRSERCAGEIWSIILMIPTLHVKDYSYV